MSYLVATLLSLGGICVFCGFKLSKSGVDPKWATGTLENWLKSDDFMKEEDKFDEIPPEFSDKIKEIQKHLKENSSDFDKHIIWISGGAVFLLTNFLSNQSLLGSSNIYFLPYIRFSISAFIGSMICTITSFIFVDRSLRKLDGVLNRSRKEMRIIGMLYKKGEKLQASKKWNKLWSPYKHFFQLGDFSLSLNISSYLLFIIGLFLLIFLLK